MASRVSLMELTIRASLKWIDFRLFFRRRARASHCEENRKPGKVTNAFFLLS